MAVQEHGFVLNYFRTWNNLTQNSLNALKIIFNKVIGPLHLKVSELLCEDKVSYQWNTQNKILKIWIVFKIEQYPFNIRPGIKNHFLRRCPRLLDF